MTTTAATLASWPGGAQAMVAAFCANKNASTASLASTTSLGVGAAWGATAPGI